MSITKSPENELGLKVHTILANLLADQYGFTISEIHFTPVEEVSPRESKGKLEKTGGDRLIWSAGAPSTLAVAS